MVDLNCGNLLSHFHAVPYQFRPLPEEMTSFGADEPLQVATDVDLDYETLRDDWKPIQTTSEQAMDDRLPKAFVDGAIASIEIAGGVQDGMGYARSIRAGQLGVGALSLDTPAESSISCGCFLAITTMGYSKAQIAPLRRDLQNHRRAFDLITWDATSDFYFRNPEEREAAVRDYATVRTRLRRRVTDVMLEREEELARQMSVPTYVDGRYVDHLPARSNQLVIGVIKSMRRRYLDIPRLQLLYNLRHGERTPAFGVESKDVQVVSFYARISPASAGAVNGLVRVEIGRAHFEDVHRKDWLLLDAVTAHMTQLRTKDVTYARASVTLEPIRVIEKRIQRLLHPMEQITMSALNALRQTAS